MLATEVALGLELVVKLRWLTGAQQAATAGSDGDLGVLSRIAARLPAATDPVASTVSRLLATADDLLAGESAASPGALR